MASNSPNQEVDWPVEVKVWFCRLIDAEDRSDHSAIREARGILGRLGVKVRIARQGDGSAE